MRSFFRSEIGHTVALIAVCLAVMLPNLGASSLWDEDEGLNAECAREMMETGTWIVPLFNYDLRTAKPVFLYWVQRFSYQAFGISEFSARLPAVLFSIGTVLLVASLGRRMFGPSTGFLAGIILATCFEFCKLAHAATPDAPLIFFVTLTLYWFWTGHVKNGRTWFFTAPIACGLAVMTKGPAYFGLIGLIIALYLLWCRELRRLLDSRLISGFLIFLAVTAPWYGAVAAETRGAWIKAFIKNENANRFVSTLEGHGGWPIFYVFAVFVFLAPWSVFLLVALRHAFRSCRVPKSGNDTENPTPAAIDDCKPYRFLLLWFAVILIVFSCSATKLPNYIATLYPALALLIGDLLVRWRMGQTVLAKWEMPAAIVCVGLIGLGIFAGLLILGGATPIPVSRMYPALAPYAGLGLLFVIGSLGMAYCLRKGDRGGVIVSLATATVLFVGLTAAFPTVAFNQYKAPKHLAMESGAFDRDVDLRIASFDFPHPTLTFYLQREVKRLDNKEQIVDFLATPRPSYLFITESKWKAFAGPWQAAYRIVAEHYDFLKNESILVVTNRAAP
ncbi:MAG: glycosyltransferase family 39 protein [Gemmataceae bacterium]